jgi:hypothetical protein
LRKIRHGIDREGERLDAVLAEPKLQEYFGELDGEQMKTVPRDYPPDHPFIHYLRYKSFTVGSSESAMEIPDTELPGHVAGRFAAAAPFVKVIRDWCR